MTLVIGATGILGSEIVRRLRAQGRPVRALVRSTSDAARRRALEEAGAEIVEGDLKDPSSIAAACRGVSSVISTASSTISRQEGDSIESVDRDGQLAAVASAAAAGVEQFVFISFPPSTVAFPLQDAKRAVEEALRTSGLTYTIIQVPHFWEVWCSAILGFDVGQRTARIYAEGTGPMSWVSLGDVAEVATRVLGHDAARNRTLTFGGPAVHTQLDIVTIFEDATGDRFTLERWPRETLQAQYDAATDPLQKSFVALMLIIASGEWVFDHEPVRASIHPDFASIRDYARRLASA